MGINLFEYVSMRCHTRNRWSFNNRLQQTDHQFTENLELHNLNTDVCSIHGLLCTDAYAIEHAGHTAELPRRSGVAGQDVDVRQQYDADDNTANTGDETERSFYTSRLVCCTSTFTRTLVHAGSANPHMDAAL